MKYEITSDGEQSSIRCLVCGATSYNPNDIANKYCGNCHSFLDTETMAQLPQQTVTDPDRQKKIIVALFLVLGKALKALPANQRGIRVTESEIREAWIAQRSPVRLVSRMEHPHGLAQQEERVFQTVLQELDLTKVGFIAPGEKFPEIKEQDEKGSHPLDRKRVFDLE
jgi:hypothetical protein